MRALSASPGCLAPRPFPRCPRLVRLEGLDFTSDLLVNRDLRLTLQVGYDCGYTGTAGILGKLRVTSGTIKLAQLRLK